MLKFPAEEIVPAFARVCVAISDKLRLLTRDERSNPASPVLGRTVVMSEPGELKTLGAFIVAVEMLGLVLTK